MTFEQEQAVEMLINDIKKYNLVLALILCGSLASNTGSKNSDVDIIVVVNDKEFDERRKARNYFCGTLFKQSNYNVYIDG